MNVYCIAMEYNGECFDTVVEALSEGEAKVEALGLACEHWDKPNQAGPHWQKILSLHCINGKVVEPVKIVDTMAAGPKAEPKPKPDAIHFDTLVPVSFTVKLDLDQAGPPAKVTEIVFDAPDEAELSNGAWNFSKDGTVLDDGFALSDEMQKYVNDAVTDFGRCQVYGWEGEEVRVGNVVVRTANIIVEES